MEAQRTCIYDIERALINEKRTYADAMNNLRIISDEVFFCLDEMIELILVLETEKFFRSRSIRADA
jgi:hypothetical protein